MRGRPRREERPHLFESLPYTSTQLGRCLCARSASQSAIYWRCELRERHARRGGGGGEKLTAIA